MSSSQDAMKHLHVLFFFSAFHLSCCEQQINPHLARLLREPKLSFMQAETQSEGRRERSKEPNQASKPKPFCAPTSGYLSYYIVSSCPLPLTPVTCYPPKTTYSSEVGAFRHRSRMPMPSASHASTKCLLIPGTQQLAHCGLRLCQPHLSPTKGFSA